MVLADLMPLPEYCPVLPWIRLDYGNNHGDRNMWASIDRIDPRIGYVAGNVRIISFRANVLKSNGTPEEIMAVAADTATRTEIV